MRLSGTEKRRAARAGKFVWTRKRRAAVKLLWEVSVMETAAQLQVSRRTLARWCQVPEFREAQERHAETDRQAILAADRREWEREARKGREQWERQAAAELAAWKDRMRAQGIAVP